MKGQILKIIESVQKNEIGSETALNKICMLIESTGACLCSIKSGDLEWDTVILSDTKSGLFDIVSDKYGDVRLSKIKYLNIHL